MSGERDYITQEQQTSQQPSVVESRPANERKPSRRKRLLQAGTVMIAMLGTSIGLFGAARNTDPSEPKIQPQTSPDILNGIGSFDNPGIPPAPNGWTAEPTDITPNYPALHANTGSAVDVETDSTLPCNSNGWITQQAYSVNPSNEYTLQFLAVYIGSESPHGINPKIILDWKNSQGQSLNNPSTYNGTAQDGAITGAWSFNTQKFGPGQNDIAIPSQAAKVTVEIKGNETDPSCVGKLYVDSLALTTTASSPTPPPVSVGGVAEQVNPNDLQPASKQEGGNNAELKVVIGEIVLGSLAAAGAGAAGWKIYSMNRENFGRRDE